MCNALRLASIRSLALTIAAVVAGCSQPQPSATEPSKASQPQTDAAAEIVKLLDGLPVGTPAEYDRIPAIWEHAIAAGRRNDATELRRLLDLSLPKPDERLADWQAVVLGGGVINGLSQAGVWPRRRLAELLGDQPDLNLRWQRSQDLAAAMADNEAVRTGTRYDALRILGADDFQRRGSALIRYLAADADGELQMGAVSGLSDMEATEATSALVEAFSGLNDHNRGLALEALRRTPQRQEALAEAIGKGTIDAALAPSPAAATE